MIFVVVNVRIKILRRKWRERESKNSQWCIQKDHSELEDLKTAYIVTKIKIPNMELKYHGQSTMDIQKNTPRIVLQFYLILFDFNIHFIHFFLHHHNT